MIIEPIVRLDGGESGAWRRFGVHVFEGKLPVSDMRRLEHAGAQWHREHPGQMVEMVVIYPSDVGMTNDERKEMARIIKRWESQRIASATVILAEGLLGAMHRSILTGLTMLSPPPHPAKVFKSIREASAWLAPHVRTLCGPEVRAEDVMTGVEAFSTAFRVRMGRQPPAKT